MDLHVTVPLPMATAALGGEIEAPCLSSAANPAACDCKVKVKIPEGAQSGRTIRLRDKGMPALRGRGRGDLVVELYVETPTHLNARQKELLRELAEETALAEQHHTPPRQLLRQGEALLGRPHGRRDRHPRLATPFPSLAGWGKRTPLSLHPLRNGPILAS